MNKVFKIGFLFFFSFVAISIAQPKMEFEGGNTYNWGTVNPKDNPLKAKIKIWNKGIDTLFIKEVKPGCGCTTAPLDKNVIPPNDFATLDISLTILGYTGPVNKDLRIMANIPNSMDYLFLNAFVARDITFVEDGFFNFGELILGNDYTKELKIKNNSKKDIKIHKIENKPDYCNINIKDGDIIPAESEMKIIAKIHPTKQGFFQFSLNIITDVSDKMDLYLTGWGEVK